MREHTGGSIIDEGSPITTFTSPHHERTQQFLERIIQAHRL